MAFSGVHIACGYIGGRGFENSAQSLLKKVSWSQTMTSAGPTTQVAPGVTPFGEPSFEIASANDIYVSWGPTPDATNGPRILIRGGDPARNVFCAAGDKLAWVLV